MSRVGYALRVIGLIGLTFYGAITIEPEQPKPDQRIAAAVDAPPTAEGVLINYEWDHGPAIQTEQFYDGSELRIWAPEGMHTLSCRTMVIDWDARTFDITDDEVTFTVGNVPDPPDPPATTLCDKVTSEQAKLLKEIYLAQISIIRSTDTTAIGFIRAHNAQLQARGLGEHGAHAEILKRITNTIGDSNKQLSDTAKGDLVVTLIGIAEDLSCDAPGPPGPPDPPTPPAGERVIVIVRESQGEPQWSVNTLHDMQSGDLDAELKDKGHKVIVLDPDSEDADGNVDPILVLLVPQITTPAIYILDQRTNKILAREPMPQSSAAVLELLKKHGG